MRIPTDIYIYYRISDMDLSLFADADTSGTIFAVGITILNF